IAGDHPERAQAGTLHMLDSLADQGHVAVPREALVERTKELLEIDPAHVEVAIDVLWAGGRVVVEGDLVFSARLHAAEVSVAADLRRLLEAPARPLPGLDAALAAFQERAGVELAPEQRRAVDAVARQKVVVITGGPGVGKTTIVRAVLSVLARAGLTVRLAAPTGRAAKRLSEATSQRATTIHRLLEYDPRQRRFAHDAERPIETDALVVDETSMVDLELAQGLFAAVPSAARLVLVGDSDQLPSVGPGAVLRDVIDSGKIPTERLARIFRQAEESRIVVNAHAILRSELPQSASPDDRNADFFVVHRTDAEQAAKTVVELVTQRIPK